MNENDAESENAPATRGEKPVSARKGLPVHAKRVKNLRVIRSTRMDRTSQTSRARHRNHVDPLHSVLNNDLFRIFDLELSRRDTALLGCLILYIAYVAFDALRANQEYDEYVLLPDYYEESKLTIKATWIDYRRRMEALYSEEIKEDEPRIDWDDYGSNS